MGQHDRQPWFGCACCPGNITRFVASVPGYMYAVQQNTVFVNLYCQSTAHVIVEKNKIELKQISSYPWDGKITIIVNPAKNAKLNMKLRIPGWAENKPVPTDLYTYAEKQTEQVKVLINGKMLNAEKQNGYVLINRRWKQGDKIELLLPMSVRRVKAHNCVKDEIDKVALERGQRVY